MNLMKSGLSLKLIETSYSPYRDKTFYKYIIRYQPDYINRNSGFLYSNQSCNFRSDNCPAIDEIGTRITIFIQGHDFYADDNRMIVSKKNVPKVLRAVTDFNNALCRKNKRYIY